MKKYLSLFLITTFCFAGCGSSKIDPSYRFVTGVVTHNGTPVAGASVLFSPLDGGLAASGVSDASGNYQLSTGTTQVPRSGTKSGKYKVAVYKVEKAVDKDAEELDAGKISYDEFMARRAKMQISPAGLPDKHLLPTVYSDVKTSPLEVIVEDKKKNVINLNLE
ncbi:MAG: carboxypeptidase-like regulatory domain-containing protein [Planctomycetaceae bacterium]|jgi:hypothetical protein|nr:carboxypeptidase-like regulatory domain-containing protein [Planctomycetaceae bacterium]